MQADLISLSMKRLGHTLRVTDKHAEALALLEEIRPRLVILDLFLRGWSGLDLLDEMKKSGWMEKTSILIISAMGFREVVQQAVALGVEDFVIKPFDLGVLEQKVERIVNG